MKSEIICADLCTVKVGIFNSIAREINPFLTMYQADQPMLPFLSEDMHKLIKGKDKHIHGVIAYALFYTLQSIRKAHKYIKCGYFSLVFYFRTSIYIFNF